MEPDVKKYIKYGVIGLVLMVAIGFLFATFETVGAGERGVVLTWGKPTATLDEGFNMVNPVSQDVIIMSVQVQKREVGAAAASKDLQTVHSKVALNYHINADKVLWLYQNVGKDFENQIIDPAIQESVKAGTALFTAEELVSKRPLVKDEIKNSLIARLQNFGIIVNDFSILNFDFSPEFNKSIEAKVTAAQDALAAQNKLEQVKYEKEQRIAQAQGEAEAIRIQAQAVTQQGGEDYVQLQAIKQWDGKLPVTMLPGASVPFINLNQNQ